VSPAALAVALGYDGAGARFERRESASLADPPAEFATIWELHLCPQHGPRAGDQVVCFGEPGQRGCDYVFPGIADLSEVGALAAAYCAVVAPDAALRAA
jgi:hypothetical protein